MAERIKKTPIKQALEAMDVAWVDAQARLDAMGPAKVLGRMEGAVYYNSSHPFRDKLHIEGFQEGLRFALTGHSSAIEYFMERVASGDIPTNVPKRESAGFRSIEDGLRFLGTFMRAGLSWRETFQLLRRRK